MLAKRNIFFSIFLSLIHFSLLAQSNRQFKEVLGSNGQIKVVVSDGMYKITPYNNKIIHTEFHPKGVKSKDLAFASYMKPEKIPVVQTHSDNLILLKINDFSIIIQKQPFKITYLYNDNLLIQENPHNDSLSITESMTFTISKDELLYGCGERVLGMNRRGNKLQLYNRAHYGYTNSSELMNYSMPMFLSSKQYAVLFDNVSKGVLDLDSKKTNTVTYKPVAGIMNYYVIAGDNWYDLLNQYTQLTGRQPLPPRWMFGNFSSRFGYHSQAETEKTVRKYAENNIPLDAIILDIYWFGKEIQGTMGNLEWYTDSFPNPNKMIENFSKKGIKTILITEPFILTTSKKWKEAVDNNVLALDSAGKAYRFDFYFGNTALIDIFNPKAKEWYWNIYKKYINQGVAGWWGDLGEPEVHPDDIRHINGLGKELHNAYGHEWAKMIYEGYKRDFPTQRPFILMRSAFAGTQRYGIIPWSGDVSRSWGGLVPQPQLTMQMGMQGISYLHSDLGGFAGGDSIDNELYTRWLQYGVFQPVFRPHAQENIAPEPVFQNTNTKRLAKLAIDLRYRLKPYIYNMAFENSITGKPLMRPLFFDEHENKDLLLYDDAYMWGDAFLVSPVKEPGKKTQAVYMPKNHHWTDFYTGKVYSGGRYHSINLSQKNIPVFVKGGSFIPMTKNAVNEQSYSLDKYEIHYFADNLIKKSTYKLYNDDGKTPDAYMKGQYEFSNFEVVSNDNIVKFTASKTTGKNYINANNKLNIIIHNIIKPKKIKLNGKTIKKKKWNWGNGILSLDIVCSQKQQVVEVYLK